MRPARLRRPAARRRRWSRGHRARGRRRPLNLVSMPTDGQPAAECLRRGHHVGLDAAAAHRPRASRFAPFPSGSRRTPAMPPPLACLPRRDDHLVLDRGRPSRPGSARASPRRSARRPRPRRASSSRAGPRRNPADRARSIGGRKPRVADSDPSSARGTHLEHRRSRVVDAAAMGVLSGELDRALVPLRARVAEEGPASEARLARPAGQPEPPALRRGWRHGSAPLPARGPPPTTAGWQCPTEHTEIPAEEVQVLVAVGIPEARTLTADELHGEAPIGRHDLLASSAWQLVHSMLSPALILVPIRHR